MKKKLNYYNFPFKINNYEIRLHKVYDKFINTREEFKIATSPLGVVEEDTKVNIEQYFEGETIEQLFTVSNNILNETTHEKNILDLIDKLISQKFNLVVFPELSLTPQIMEAVIDKLDKVKRKSISDFIFVTGSCHKKNEQGKNINVTAIVSNKLKDNIYQNKMNTFINYAHSGKENIVKENLLKDRKKKSRRCRA